eukprot:gb/GECG01014517.1/.p1 GENE.gb/GECG01014517.1/~~gb/GECG01014517.1/.p1  ORF type:complete len:211 (+),score=31.72 gb/GECG01014517.1/:1-633(+)
MASGSLGALDGSWTSNPAVEDIRATCMIQTEPGGAHSTPATPSEDSEDPTVFLQIIEMLNNEGIPFQHMHHRQTLTSEESAAVRGAALHSGAKAMLVALPAQADRPQDYALVVMAADKKVDWKVLRKKLGKKARLVGKDDVLQVSGCVSGAVPPFGSMLKTAAKTLVDVSLRDQGSTINFNAGLTTDSVCMRLEDFVKLESPEICEFCQS